MVAMVLSKFEPIEVFLLLITPLTMLDVVGFVGRAKQLVSTPVDYETETLSCLQ